MSQPSTRLDPKQVAQRLEELSDWTLNGDTLQRTFGFEDFVGAMEFVNRVAELAEQRQHHPDIMIRYGKVTLTLSTHDAGGITEKDFGFARSTNDLSPAA